ncbi:hypothetical protein V8F06_004929 [Rhypophila decipiens]
MATQDYRAKMSTSLGVKHISRFLRPACTLSRAWIPNHRHIYLVQVLVSLTHPPRTSQSVAIRKREQESVDKQPKRKRQVVKEEDEYYTGDDIDTAIVQGRAFPKCSRLRSHYDPRPSTRSPRSFTTGGSTRGTTNAVSVLQKVIEHVTTPVQIHIIRGALQHQVVELIQDLNGNHVIQKCLNKLTARDAEFIFNAVGNKGRAFPEWLASQVPPRLALPLVDDPTRFPLPPPLAEQLSRPSNACKIAVAAAAIFLSLMYPPRAGQSTVAHGSQPVMSVTVPSHTAPEVTLGPSNVRPEKSQALQASTTAAPAPKNPTPKTDNWKTSSLSEEERMELLRGEEEWSIVKTKKSSRAKKTDNEATESANESESSAGGGVAC